MKKLIVLCIAFLITLSSVCSATVDTSRVGINGIAVGSHKSNVYKVFGTPDGTGGYDKGKEVLYYFEGKQTAKPPFVFYIGYNDEVATFMALSSNAVTLDGVKIGMPADVLGKVYGAADKVEGSKYIYYTKAGGYLEFRVNNNGCISFIAGKY